jgi:putative hydrolase of the HAD superfamily
MTYTTIETIAFDADDTLWHNERIFISAKEKYKRLLARYHEPDWIEERLDVTESRNIRQFGYGVKGFTLSMIETAVELTEGRVTGNEISDIIGFAREMLESPIEILKGVPEAVEELSGSHRLMVITKGDLFDQEAKISRSGLGAFFEEVEIVSEKTVAVYEKITGRHRIDVSSFLMVGNSVRSDILPVIEIGGQAVHVPYETEWFHERVDESELEGKEFVKIRDMSELPEWVKNRI